MSMILGITALKGISSVKKIGRLNEHLQENPAIAAL
jgi:hypothetical protein